jgi:hypothetical protein
MEYQKIINIRSKLSCWASDLSDFYDENPIIAGKAILSLDITEADLTPYNFNELICGLEWQLSGLISVLGPDLTTANRLRLELSHIALNLEEFRCAQNQ